MTFRKMFLCILLFHLSNITCSQVQDKDTLFDKNKWLVSSAYRYKIVHDKAFPKIQIMNRKQIIKLLGKPYSEEDGNLSYCLDIISKENGKIDCYAILLISKEKSGSLYQTSIIRYDHEKRTNRCVIPKKKNAELSNW